MRVAKQWEQVIGELAAFWAHLECGIPPDALEQSLTRAKAHPLTIECHGEDWGGQALYFLTHVSVRTEQWEEALVSLESFVEHEECFERPAPKFRNVELMSEEEEARVIDLFRGQADRLEAVVLDRVAIRVSNALPLQHIVLKGP